MSKASIFVIGSLFFGAALGILTSSSGDFFVVWRDDREVIKRCLCSVFFP